MSAQNKAVITLIVSTLFVVLLMLIVRQFDLEHRILLFLEYIQNAGLYGRILFMVAVIIAVVGLVPSVLLTLGAGLVYGLAEGSLLMVLAETIGATFAFFFGRHLFTRSAFLLLSKFEKLRVLISLPGRHDWKLVAITRMIPFFPFKLSNYFFGLTPLSVASYLVGTFLGLWPVTLFNVYLGSVAADLMSLKDAGSPHTAAQWAMYVGGFAVTGAILLIAVRRANRMLDATLSSTLQTERKKNDD